jgi:hypothetical protein
MLGSYLEKLQGSQPGQMWPRKTCTKTEAFLCLKWLLLGYLNNLLAIQDQERRLTNKVTLKINQLEAHPFLRSQMELLETPEDRIHREKLVILKSNY